MSEPGPETEAVTGANGGGSGLAPVRSRDPYATRFFAAYVAAGCGLGALAGVVWWRSVDLVAYTVGQDGRATTTERGLTGFFAGDAWFCLIGAVVGLLLGIFAWRRFRRAGWVLPLLVVGTAMLAALLCWLVGYWLGPGDFTHRIATAEPGQRVPITLTLRAPVSLLIWPFVAVIPVLLGSSLGRDDEEPRPLRRRRPDTVAASDRGSEPRGTT